MINAYACHNGAGVCADPNYHLSPAGWSGGGSPWTQNGGGWVEGNPGGGFGTAMGPEFENQWAFGEDGISLIGSTLGTQEVREKALVRIGVFDTSPFPDTSPVTGEEWTPALAGSHPYQQIVLPWGNLMGGVSAELTEDNLTVWHFDVPDTSACPGKDRRTGKTLENQDLSNHGLFVSSLAHAVSPSSEIYLVRVLQGNACGSLLSIIQGIEMFMDDAIADRSRGEIAHIVLNLSLGVHQPPNPACFGLPEEVHALRFAIDRAVADGAIVIAAAGNDSYNSTSNAPEDMEIPAVYPNVIGVAASNRDRSRGCFSNADLDENANTMAAPGGDGVPRVVFADEAETKILNVPCAVPTCKENTDPCVIGLVFKPDPGYAYWVGTSFAAPLVSGQKALFLEDGGVFPQTTCLSSDATLPHGIINLRASEGVPCPTPSLP
jgi:subtilisin family serine protease